MRYEMAMNHYATVYCAGRDALHGKGGYFEVWGEIPQDFDVLEEIVSFFCFSKVSALKKMLFMRY